MILPRMKLIFQSCCFLMAIYWTALFSSNYSENSDDISITIKEFNHDFEDKYPTFSICIKGTDIHWFQGHEIFMAYGFNASKYESMLKGEVAMKYEYDYASKLYKKKPVYVNHGIDVKFNRFHLQISELLSDLKFTSENVAQIDEKLVENSSNTTIESNIHLTYQSPDAICFTRNSSDPIKSIRIQDLVTFDSSNLRSRENKHVEMQIFTHYPGQLISSFDKPKYKSSLSYLLSSLKQPGSTYNVLDFKVSQCRMLRKREDSNVPCNKKIRNHDHFIMQRIINRLGCIPPYWRNIIAVTHQINECTGAEKLKEAYRYLSNFKKILNEEDHSCDEILLQSIDSINYRPTPMPQDISMAFYYTEKIYEEIRYTRAMGFESWLSNVGGFVGIFLGYSIMQIPDILFHILKSLFQRKNKCFTV